MNPRKATVAALVTVVATVGGWLIAPSPPRLGDAATGDPSLVRQVRQAVPDPEGRLGLAVALVENGRVRTAGLGDTGGEAGPVRPSTPFEIGSVTKALTGMQLADLAQRGAVDPRHEVARLLPGVAFDDPTVATASLAELASHRSGLPSLPSDVELWVRGVGFRFLGTNPYAGVGADELVSAAAGTDAVRERGEFGYSNLGMSLLGQALARETGTGYPELVTRRILDPLGMDATAVLEPDAPLPEPRALGHRENGMRVAPWRGSGFAPAGIGVWSNAEDLGRFVDAALAGTAPGGDATRPRFAAGEGERIGFGWFTTRHGEHEITWHNGGTGGFRSYLGFDRATGRGVVVLANTAKPVDAIGLRLLDVAAPGEDSREGWSYGAVGAGLLCMYAAGCGLFAALRRGGKRPDRIGIVSLAGEAAIALTVAYVVAGWTLLPPALWTGSAAVAAGGLAVLGLSWSGLPVRASGRAWVRWPGMVLRLGLVAGAVGYLVTVV